MSVINIQHFILYIITTTILRNQCVASKEIQVNFQMREETPPFTMIGSIGPSLPEGLGQKLHYITDSNFFSVTPSAGEVRVTRLIDRERLCPEHKLCCGLLTCQLEGRIFVTDRVTGEFAASVTLKVDIQDQNDNRPVFASTTQKVSVSEASKVGSYFGLTPALDADIEPTNQIQRYTLVEPTGTFILDTSELPSVRLHLIKPLDREKTSSYTATLEACDPGACARQTLQIEILDENDNKPIFPQTTFVKHLMENMKVGELVLKLNATDADSEERGRVVYSLRGVHDPDLLETFEFSLHTGEIRLKRSLSANIRDNYRFKVIACDAASPSCTGHEHSTADINFIVDDVNNFAPSIHIVAAGVAQVTDELTTKSETDSTFNEGLNILENTPPSQVAVITVKDADLGENARVHCELGDGGSGEFILSPSAPGVYALRTARMFDHEVEPLVTTKVICNDFGSPERMTAARVITVKVNDVNEFQPEFSRRVYTGRIAENAPAGMEILTTSATDRDKGAELRYSLAPANLQQANWNRLSSDMAQADTTTINDHFVIEPKTGTIRTSQIPLDREKIASVTLIILVTDSQLPPVYTATTTVSIDILDENDNAPIFINPPTELVSPASPKSEHVATRSFTVVENSPRFTRLNDQLEARDPDQGDNGRLTFSLLSTYALTKYTQTVRSPMAENSNTANGGSRDSDIDTDLLSEFGSHKKITDHPIFRITPDGGIETLVELDREAVPSYLLKIGVQDRGVQPLTSTAVLRIDVLDTNDNAPIWIFPTPVDRTINLTTAMKPGSLAGRLRAEDADLGDAGRVEYMFLGPGGERLQGVSLEEGLFKSLNSEDKVPTIQKETSSGPKSNDVLYHGYRVGPFYLNGTTGEIWIAQILTAGAMTLHLRAKDQGNPATQTDAWLTINVFVDPSEEVGFFNFGGDGTLNITIILVMITITAIVSLFLIVGIVCVRRRPARYIAGNTAATNDGIMPPSGTTSPYSVDTNKELLALGPGAWSTPAGMYTAGQYYPSQGQMFGRLSEDGQYFTTIGSPKAMGYGAVLSPTDGHGIIYVPHGTHQQAVNAMGSTSCGSATPVQMEHGFVPIDYPTPGHMQTFGTLGRNRTGSNAFIGSSFEPHVDGDSGDSGRGPSEEGNQFFSAECYRNGMFVNGSGMINPYQTFAGYRPSSRMTYRNVDDVIKLHPISGCNHNGNMDCDCGLFDQPQPHYHSLYNGSTMDYNANMYKQSYPENDPNQMYQNNVAPGTSPRVLDITIEDSSNNAMNDQNGFSPSHLVDDMHETDNTSSVQYSCELQNGHNPTPLRLDLRNPNVSDERELSSDAFVTSNQRKQPMYNHAKNGPLLPPLATKRLNVSANVDLSVQD